MPRGGRGCRLQYVALDTAPLAALLEVAVGRATVVRLPRADLPHQVEEHLQTQPSVSRQTTRNKQGDQDKLPPPNDKATFRK